MLSELDKLKVTGKDTVKEKAERLTRQFREYRRRGNLHDGVTVRKNIHTIRALAVEPDFDNTLPWLDPKNNDDRILATFVEIIRQHPRSPVVLVTRDTNLINKADFARFPSVEPPDPKSVTPTK